MRSCALIFLLYFIAFTNANNIFAQSNVIDSLKNSLLITQNTQSASDINYALANELYRYNYEQGKAFAQEAQRLAEEAQYSKGKAQALTAIADYYYYTGDNQTAEQYYHKAVQAAQGKGIVEFPIKTFLRLSILKRKKSNFDSAWYYLHKVKELLPKVGQDKLRAAFYASTGILANQQSQNKKAIKYLKKSLQIRMKLNDTTRLADTWRNIGVSYMDISAYDSAAFAFYHAESLLNLSENPETRMTLLMNKGEMYFAKGAVEEAIENYKQALDKLQANTYREYYSKLLYNLGELYSNQNDFNAGYNYLFKAASEFERLDDRQSLAKTYSTIGWNYIFQENYNKAKDYGEKSLKIVLEIGDSAGISKSQNLIGFASLKNGDLTNALNYFDSAYTIRHHLGLKWGETYSMYNQALVFIALGKKDTALALLNSALDLAKSINNKSAMIYICNELGHLYSEAGNFKLADFHLQKAQQISMAVPLVSGLLTNYKNYIALYELKKDSKNSLKYHKLYIALKDSTDQIVSSGRIANADALFQVNQKAEELQTTMNENLLQKEQIVAQSTLIKEQKRVLIIISISLFFLILLMGAIVRLAILRSKAKEKLRLQNLAIQEQKEEILTQSEELIEANQHLGTLNETLSEKNVEIEAQSDLLSEINDSLEKEVAKRTKELSRAYQELETFFYKASHDFRRPLTTYLGLVEVAKSTITDQDALELFDKVRLTTVGLDNMIHKLQAIGNIDYKTETVDVSLSAIIINYLQAHEAEIKEKQIQITLPKETIHLNHNYSLLKVILSNLLENAILFHNPHKPHININWQQSEKNTTITIEDNGTGIAENIQPRIFDMFFRGNEQSQGNGLGLYVTKRAVDKLGGTISFSSIPNVGSTFTVSVPNHLNSNTN